MARGLGVLALTLIATAAAAGFYLARSAFEEEALRTVLRFTAWLAFAVYLLIFVARPLQQLRPSRPARWLLRNRRYLGISFAGIMIGHLVFLLWLNGFVFAVPGIVAYALILLMLVTSFDRPKKAIGPRRWRLLHKTGIYLTGTLFAGATAIALWQSPTRPLLLVFATLALAAGTIRIAAYRKSRA